MELKHIQEKDFEKEVTKSKQPVIVDFFATWCGPCKMLGPILEDIADEEKDVKILKVDIDENMNLAQQFGIMSVPTLMLFKDGEEYGREIGLKSKEQLKEIISELK
ncbi:MAG: thioredoxin [Clostridia bacterium]|nr:thioredoxin [Clostridia bacterium]